MSSYHYSDEHIGRIYRPRTPRPLSRIRLALLCIAAGFIGGMVAVYLGAMT